MKYLKHLLSTAIILFGVTVVVWAANLVIPGDILSLAEISTPTAIDSRGAIYPSSDNNLHFQAGDGTLYQVAGRITKHATTAGITASTTQEQSQGALTTTYNEVSTVANPNDTVTLPTSAAGLLVTVINNGANTLQIFPASSDNLGAGMNLSTTLEANESILFEAYDDTNWHVGAETEIIHAEVHDEDNTDAFGVSIKEEVHSYHTNGFIAGDLDGGWTFDTGGAGTSFPIASITDSPGSSGSQAQITTTGSHLLVAGDIVSLTNLSAGTNAGVFVVTAPVAATTFEIISSDSTDATGTMDQAATLDIGDGSGGVYELTWWASATSATNNETFDFQLYKKATPIVGTKVRRKFGTATDFGSFSGGGIISLTDGDKISLQLINEDTAGDITIRNLTIVIIRL